MPRLLGGRWIGTRSHPQVIPPGIEPGVPFQDEEIVPGPHGMERTGGAGMDPTPPGCRLVTCYSVVVRQISGRFAFEFISLNLDQEWFDGNGKDG